MEKEAQIELDNIDKNIKTDVKIPRSKLSYKIGYLKPDTSNRISRAVLINEAPSDLFNDDENSNPNPRRVVGFMASKTKITAKMAAYIILNDFWKNSLFHFIYWRWLYYFRQLDFGQLAPVVIEGKKKMGAEGYYLIMASSVMMMDTMRTMTKAEAKEYLAVLSSETKPHSDKNTLGL